MFKPEIGMRVRVNYVGGVHMLKGDEGIITDFDFINNMARVGSGAFVKFEGLDFWIDGEWVKYESL